MRNIYSLIGVGAWLAMTVPGAHAAAILTVGARGADYTTVSAAVQFADTQTGTYYTIEIAPGLYVNDFSVITAPMTIEALSGGPVILDAVKSPSNDKGIFTTSASATIIGLTFENAAVSAAAGSNGAGIRDQAGTTSLIVENSIFRNDQDGILADAYSPGSVLISGSSFIADGFDAGGGACPGTGCDHAVYVGAVNSLVVANSLFCGTNVGHDIKSRAATTTITGNRLYDGAADSADGCPAGSTSYAIDAPNGGDVSITGNQIVQGAGTENPIMVDYGEEGVLYANNSLLVSGNIFINTDVPISVGVNDPSCVPAQSGGNSFQGVNTDVSPARCVVSLVRSVPEPTGLLLLVSGVAGIVIRRARAVTVKRHAGT